jgi:hypothetical protein
MSQDKLDSVESGEIHNLDEEVEAGRKISDAKIFAWTFIFVPIFCVAMIMLIPNAIIKTNCRIDGIYNITQTICPTELPSLRFQIKQNGNFDCETKFVKMIYEISSTHDLSRKFGVDKQTYENFQTRSTDEQGFTPCFYNKNTGMFQTHVKKIFGLTNFQILTTISCVVGIFSLFYLLKTMNKIYGYYELDPNNLQIKLDYAAAIRRSVYVTFILILLFLMAAMVIFS